MTKKSTPKMKRRPKGSGTEPHLIVRMPRQLIDQLQQLADDQQTTKSDVVRKIIERSLKCQSR
jgi:predicted DNA-binding protein